MKEMKKILALMFIGAISLTCSQASTDYGPAIYREAYPGHWYTSGNGHKFHVIHDMEGYYQSTISYFQRSTTQASSHYCINGLKDYASDAERGEVTQMVREAYYAWHARCWNTHSYGTEHEGFVSNPAWYTEEMYQASAALSRHLAARGGFAKDRNHIIGHDQKRISGWPAYASANLGIDPYCNDHTDPGLNWNWSHYMALINPTTTTIVKDNPSATFVGSWSTGTSAADKYGSDYRFKSTAPVSEPATWTTSLPSSGNWTVYVWYPAGSNRSTAAPYIISTAAGSHTEYVNQQITGGAWVNQGTYNMNAGTATIKLSCWAASGFVVVADAVRWVK
jgi:N-acetyl-anhydromuramyl-L-alanine amidase AmpD